MRRRAARERKFGVRRQPRSRGDRSRRTATDVVVASVPVALKQAIGESFVFAFRLLMTGVGPTKKCQLGDRPELPQNIFLIFREPEITKVSTGRIDRHLIAQCLFEFFD
jgi:hypothetical protein